MTNELIEMLEKFMAYHRGYDEEMGIRIDDLMEEAERIMSKVTKKEEMV